MEEYRFSVQTALMPLYYKEFQCLMGACQDNCCDDGWRIEFSKKDYLTVKRAVRAKGLEELAEQSLRRLREREHDGMYAEFRLNKRGGCAFHTPEGLCRLQLECGAEALPSVCRRFPRKLRDTSAGRELALSPACEGVLALLWDLPQGIDFLEEDLPKKDWVSYSTGNPFTIRFPEIRSLCVDVLQERSLRLSQRFLLLGILIEKLRKLDWNTGEGIDAWLAQGEASLHDPELTAELDRLPGNQQMFLTHNHGVATMLMLWNVGERRTLAHQLCESIKTAVPGKERRTILDVRRYRELERALLERFPELDEFFFENLMVSVAFGMQFPHVASPEDMWRSYVNLCSLYSFYRFSAVCGSAGEVSRERLFHILVIVSRMILHNSTRQNQLREELFRKDSATLAHMAILVNG